ncbi:hypothetical protein A2U01_0112031, partial [Trifolium medium]|nr:hypothetical protein [Trifolium medium]
MLHQPGPTTLPC